ncbi:MAG: hypothetical protein IPH62_19595 [Ignavibacteriae bacterium]|nr:hypothetical protein [Ignavibacteriota bacterium]
MAYIGLVRCGNFLPDNTVVEVQANTLILNSEEQGAGIGAGFAQIVINRGTLPAAIIRFNEVNDKFEVGFSNSSEYREIENSIWKFIDVDTILEVNTNYFVDVGSLTSINLILPPNPRLGDTIKIVDVASQFCQKNVYIRRNDKKIMNADDDIKLDSGNIAVSMVYSDSNHGWRFV